jgi:hypothetical protein
MLLRRRPKLRKILIAVFAACFVIAGATVALAQSAQKASLQTKVSPKKAGTAKKPVNTSLYFKVTNQNPNATLAKLDILIPKTLKLYTGKKWPSCSQATLDNRGKSKCPKGSQVGTGTASAVLGVNNPPGKPRSPLTFRITTFVGGQNKLNFFLESNELKDLKITSPGKISKNTNGYKLTILVPKAAQSPDGVTYAGLQDIVSTLSGKYKGNQLIGSVGCKNKAHLLNTKLYFVNNGADQGGTTAASAAAPCSK